MSIHPLFTSPIKRRLLSFVKYISSYLSFHATSGVRQYHYPTMPAVHHSLDVVSVLTRRYEKGEPAHTGAIAGAAVGIIGAIALVLVFLGCKQKRSKPKAGSQPINWSRLPHKHPPGVPRGGYHAQALMHFDEVRRGGTSSEDSLVRGPASPPLYKDRRAPPSYNDAKASNSPARPPKALTNTSVRPP